MNDVVERLAFYVQRDSVLIGEKYYDILLEAQADNRRNALSAKKYNWLLNTLVEFDLFGKERQKFSLLMETWQDTEDLDKAIEELMRRENL